jgi:formylglycine-generating enzyme required for sulfatase activity
MAGDGEKAFLLLSDCMAPHWTDRQRLWSLLASWTHRAPVALVQMLPRDMWPGTGLEQTPVVNLRAFVPAYPSAKLSPDEGPPRSGTLKLPVVTLDPHSLRAWAGLMLGHSREWSAGLAFSAKGAAHAVPGTEAGEPAAETGAAAEQALEDFRAIASPEAQELVACFAALPLTLPVMRLARHVLMPGTRLAHLAEVFLGGLIERDDLHLAAEQRERDPQRIRFDICRRLLNTLPDEQVEAVIRALSEVVERRLGRVSDFIALMLDPSAAGKVPLDEDSLPFARVRLQILRRLSGDYAPLADALEEAISEWSAKGGAGVAMPTEPTPFRDGSGEGPYMVWLPGGTFRMGSPEGVGYDAERPAHDVTLSHFAVGKYPLTVGELRRFVKATGYKTEAEREGGADVWNRGNPEQKKDANWRKPYMEQDDRHPVVCISWNDGNAYCKWLSKETGQTYGLLTEAQWEHACRAGSDTAYCFGNDEQRLEAYAWFGDSSPSGSTHGVGEKRPNGWASTTCTETCGSGAPIGMPAATMNNSRRLNAVERAVATMARVSTSTLRVKTQAVPSRASTGSSAAARGTTMPTIAARRTVTETTPATATTTSASTSRVHAFRPMDGVHGRRPSA